MPVLTDKTVLMDSEGIRRALTRISHEIVEKNKGVYTLTIDQNNQWQTIEVVTTDAAGNESVDHRIEQNTAYKVLVTPNLFYQYINRLPLVGGSLAALAGLIFFLIAKRKKDDEEEENAA